MDDEEEIPTVVSDPAAAGDTVREAPRRLVRPAPTRPVPSVPEVSARMRARFAEDPPTVPAATSPLLARPAGQKPARAAPKPAADVSRTDVSPPLPPRAPLPSPQRQRRSTLSGLAPIPQPSDDAAHGSLPVAVEPASLQDRAPPPRAEVAVAGPQGRAIRDAHDAAVEPGERDRTPRDDAASAAAGRSAPHGDGVVTVGPGMHRDDVGTVEAPRRAVAADDAGPHCAIGPGAHAQAPAGAEVAAAAAAARALGSSLPGAMAGPDPARRAPSIADEDDLRPVRRAPIALIIASSAFFFLTGIGVGALIASGGSDDAGAGAPGAAGAASPTAPGASAAPAPAGGAAPTSAPNLPVAPVDAVHAGPPRPDAPQQAPSPTPGDAVAQPGPQAPRRATEQSPGPVGAAGQKRGPGSARAARSRSVARDLEELAPAPTSPTARTVSKQSEPASTRRAASSRAPDRASPDGSGSTRPGGFVRDNPF